MKYYQKYSILAALFLSTACQDEINREDISGDSPNVEINASIAGQLTAPTKANTESNGTLWNPGDQLALRNTASADYFTYIYRNGKWGPDGSEYLKWPGDQMTIAAYYPVTAKDGNFTLPTNQSDTLSLRSADFMSTATLRDNQTAAYPDTLVSREGESYSINLVMHRRMTKVVLNFTKKKNITDLKINSAYTGFANDQPTGGLTTLTPMETLNQVTEGQTFTAIVVPAENGSSQTFLSLKEKGTPYTLEGIPAMEPGYEYTYSVMFNDEKKLSLATVTVKPWDENVIAMGGGTTKVITYAKKGFWDPMIAKEGNIYYMICSDGKTPGYPYKPGLQLFTSTDLISFEQEATVLANLLSDWGLEAFKACAAKNNYEVQDESAVYVGHPYLYKGDDGWYLLYTIQDETTPICITGYAFSPTLANAQWTDKQSFIETAYHDKFRPMNPTIGKSGSHFMTLLLGDRNKSTYRWWQYRLGGVNKETISRNTSREYSYMAGKALVNPLQTFIYKKLIHHFFLFSDYSICHAYSKVDWRYNAPADYCGTSATSPTNPATDGNVKVLTPYRINDGMLWKNIGGAHAFEDGNGNWYVVHHASARTSNAAPTFQIRSMHWLDTDITQGTQPVPVICPEPYTAADHKAVQESDIPGTWYFGNLKTINTSDAYNHINDKLVLVADGSATLNGSGNYTWTYNEATHILTLKLDVEIYLYVQGVTKYESGKVTFAAAGVTSDAKNSSYWMEKE